MAFSTGLDAALVNRTTQARPPTHTQSDCPFKCSNDCQLKTLCRTLCEPKAPVEKEPQSIVDSSLLGPATEPLYTPLLPWQIRLLRILPGAAPDPLQCELLIADLICFPGAGLVSTGAIVEYDAISYSWADSRQQISMQCNNHSVLCGKTPAEALVNLRQLNVPRVVWLDSLCINQADSTEKSAQVRIMFTIFSKARQVIAWLGMPRLGEIPILNILAFLAEHDCEEHMLDDIHDKACLSLLPLVSEGLRSLLSRPWFSRTWIRQEAYANTNVLLRSGDFSATIQQFYGGLDVIQKVKDETIQVDTYKREPNLVCVYLMRVSRGQPGTYAKKDAPPLPISNGLWLSGILAGCRFGVTDERDRVYGNIGMLDAKSEDWLRAYCKDTKLNGPRMPPVDYLKTKLGVYQDIVRFLINRHECLSPLIIFQRRTWPTPPTCSWALNLDEDITRWYLATHMPLQDLSQLVKNLPSERSSGSSQQFWRQGLTALRDAAIGSLPIVRWESYQGRFKPPKLSFDDSPNLILPGFVIGRAGPQIRDDGDFRELEAGPGLQRSPVSADTGFAERSRRVNKKIQVSELGVTKADVKTLIAECDQKVVGLILQQDWVQVDEVSMTSLCTRLLVSDEVCPGDLIVLLHGSSLPVVLRHVETRDTLQYGFLGPAMWLTFPEKTESINTQPTSALIAKQRLLDRAKIQYDMYCDQIAALDVEETEFALV